MIRNRCDHCEEMKPLKEWRYLLRMPSGSYPLKANLCGGCTGLVEGDLWEKKELISKLLSGGTMELPGSKGMDTERQTGLSSGEGTLDTRRGKENIGKCYFCGEVRPLKEWRYAIKTANNAYPLRADICSACTELVENDLWKKKELIGMLLGRGTFKAPAADGVEIKRRVELQTGAGVGIQGRGRSKIGKCYFCEEIRPLKEWRYVLKMPSNIFPLRADICSACAELVENDLWKKKELIGMLLGRGTFKAPASEKIKPKEPPLEYRAEKDEEL